MEYIPRRQRRAAGDANTVNTAPAEQKNAAVTEANAEGSAGNTPTEPQRAASGEAARRAARERAVAYSESIKKSTQNTSVRQSAPRIEAIEVKLPTVATSKSGSNSHGAVEPNGIAKARASSNGNAQRGKTTPASKKAANKKAANKKAAKKKKRSRRRIRDPRLRRIANASAALRALCATAIFLTLLLLPRTEGGETRTIRVDLGDKVVMPIDVSTPAPTEAPTPEPTPASITISAAGDCTLGYDPRLGYENSLPHELERQGGDFGYFFRGVLPVFESDDITLVNLECAFTTSNDRVEGKTYCFKGDPSYYNMLLQGNIEVVSLGNNHAYDYHQKGFDDTIEALDAAGIGYAVNGVSYVTDVNGIRTGFLSYRNNTPERATLRDDIQRLRADACDLVICCFHWGEEYRNVANSDQRTLGRAAVDYGADLVIGHHPHVIGSIEKYKGVYIVYSLGNFCFGGNRNPPDKDSFIFRQTFTMGDDGLPHDSGITIVPCRISSVTSRNNYQPTIYGEEDAKRVLQRLNEYSRPLDYGVELDESVLQWEW